MESIPEGRGSLLRAVRGCPGLEEGEEEARERADVEEAWWETVRQWHAQATAQNEHLAPVKRPNTRQCK